MSARKQDPRLRGEVDFHGMAGRERVNKRLREITEDARSFETVLLADYNDEERRHLFAKLSEHLCRFCWRPIKQDEHCACEEHAHEVLSLVHLRPGVRFQIAEVGDVISVVLSKMCHCENSTAGSKLLNAAFRGEHKALLLRPNALSDVIRVLLAELDLEETRHTHTDQAGTKQKRGRS